MSCLPPVTVTAWIGSENTGDELVHAGLRRLLAARGVDVTAVSLDPVATVARHGGRSIPAGRAVLQLASGRRLGPVVLGGGGLLQDETSALNLPRHLAPLAVARAHGLPVVGVGLGAGPILGALARRIVRRELGGVPLAVRDALSADLLAGVGLARPVVAADLAFALPGPVPTDVRAVLVVALRPWDGRRHRLPVGLRPGASQASPAEVARLTAIVDAVASRLGGLAVRFVAFDKTKDHGLHRAIAARVRADVVDVLAPDPDGALALVAGAHAVLAMRYHAGVAALLGRRPALLLDYSPKVSTLAVEVGAGFAVSALDVPPELAADAAVGAVVAAETGVLEGALDRMRERATANGAVLDQILDP